MNITISNVQLGWVHLRRILFMIFACLILKQSKVHDLIIVNEYWLHG